MPEARTILRGGTIVDGAGSEPREADLAMRGSIIEAVGTIVAEPEDTVVDVTGRYLLPGFIDAHSHADAAVFSTDVQRGLLRQGVTTVIAGQDGVSYAPGDGAYATEYFGALNGRHPTYGGGGVAELLASYDEATLIPRPRRNSAPRDQGIHAGLVDTRRDCGDVRACRHGA